jgi:hypothetical protein
VSRFRGKQHGTNNAKVNARADTPSIYLAGVPPIHDLDLEVHRPGSTTAALGDDGRQMHNIGRLP